MKLWKKFTDLPSVPTELINSCRTIDLTSTDIGGYNKMMPGYQGRWLIKDQAHFQSARSKRYELPKELVHWIKTNIVADCNPSISITPPTSPCWGPHADITSQFNLIYVLSPGGPKCTTHWWYQKGQDPYHLPEPGSYVTDYDDLCELDQVKMEPLTWYCIDQRYLHSVENITQSRIAMHVRLKTSVMPELIP